MLHSLVPRGRGSRRRGFLLLDFSLEEATTFGFVYHFDVLVVDRGVAPVTAGRVPVVVHDAASATQVDVGRAPNNLHARMAILIGQARPKAVDARRLGFGPSSAVNLASVFAGAVAVAV